MQKGQVKVVAQIQGRDDDDNVISHRQLPAFLVYAFCFPTATSIVKTMFKDQNVAGQLMDSDGNVKNFRS